MPMKTKAFQGHFQQPSSKSSKSQHVGETCSKEYPLADVSVLLHLFIFLKNFMYLFLTVLCLCCSVSFSLVAASGD